MEKISAKQKQLIAEFLTNIGVAWFAGGVIGVFIGKPESIFTIIGSFSWGIVLSLVSLWSGVLLIKGGK